MKLKSWLEREGLSVAAFARRLNKPQPTVARYVNGDRMPEPDTMRDIARETANEVMPNDFYDVPSLSPELTPAEPDRVQS